MLLFLTEPMQYLPKAALGAVIVAAAIGLVDRGPGRGLARTSQVEVAIAAVTMAGVVAVGVLEALLVAVVGVLIARGLFDVPLLAPTGEGALGDAGTARLAGLAAAAALLATGLMHLLLLSTPRPGTFFSWIMVLATPDRGAPAVPADAEPATKVATAAVNLAIGAAIGSLVSSIARSAVRVVNA